MNLCNSRFVLILLLTFFITSCSAGKHPARTNNDEGIISAHARNVLAAENPEGLVRVAEGFEKSANYQGALNLYGQAMAANPNLSEAQIGYARVLLKTGQAGRALAMLKTVIEREPTSASAKMVLVNYYIKSEDYISAEKLVNEMIKEDQVSPEALFFKGQLDILAGDAEQGRTFFAKAIDLSPNNSDFLHALAYSYALEGDFKTAVSIIQQSFNKASGYESGRRALANVYALSGQVELALELLLGEFSVQEIERQRLYFKLLNVLDEREKRRAIYFSHFPKDAVARLQADQ